MGTCLLYEAALGSRFPLVSLFCFSLEKESWRSSPEHTEVLKRSSALKTFTSPARDKRGCAGNRAGPGDHPLRARCRQ